jgi:hypothetical protein
MKGPCGPFLAFVVIILLMVLLPGMPETIVIGSGAANIIDPRMVAVAVIAGLVSKNWLGVIAGCAVATVVFMLTPHSAIAAGRPDIAVLQVIGLWTFTSLIAMLVALGVGARNRRVGKCDSQDT